MGVFDLKKKKKPTTDMTPEQRTEEVNRAIQAALAQYGCVLVPFVTVTSLGIAESGYKVFAVEQAQQ